MKEKWQRHNKHSLIGGYATILLKNERQKILLGNSVFYLFSQGGSHLVGVVAALTMSKKRVTNQTGYLIEQ
ncbi:hypothetical protein DLH90_16795 [Vibrio parahaemolyticus]|nr:hypothetical protein [Vibrio parahaemolyticus]EGR2888666.1 hypothetical protein [Vibrio parahaemolyticus]KIT25209.1 hypothetical protein H323_07460 [Vibrio parahaemolyticus VP766]